MTLTYDFDLLHEYFEKIGAKVHPGRKFQFVRRHESTRLVYQL